MSAVACATATDRRVSRLHPAIGEALNAFPHPVATRARDVVGAVLWSRTGGMPVDGWSGSKLTGDGFPVEVSFCTDDDRLRLTVEPGQADLDPRKRLGTAAGVLQQLGSPVPDDALAAFQAVQRQGSLKYGAWIGCRVSPEGTAFKLYVEMPDGHPENLFVSPLTLPDRVVTARMVGCVPGSQSLELYARVPSLEPRHVPAVLAPAGFESRAREVLDFVSESYGYSISGRLPGPSVGVSYRIGPPPTARVTLYFFARALWGSDARIRRRFLETAAARGWNQDAYARVTAPMAARESWQTFHGLLGITLDRYAMSLAIGVRPVSA